MAADPKRARILIIEDDRWNGMLYQRLLGQHFDIELVEDVESALELARHGDFDLFLLDIKLGEALNGLDLLRLLRQMPAYDATPAVSCTAYAGRSYRDHFLASGFDAHVDKPFSRRGLLGAIDRALAGDGLHGQA